MISSDPYVYLIYTPTGIYVGSGKDKRVLQSMKERGGTHYKILYSSPDRDELYRLEDIIWKGLTKRGFLVINGRRPGRNEKCGGKHSDEAKRRMSEAMKGIPKSEEHKKKINEKMVSQGIYARQSERLRGKLLTIEERIKIREAMVDPEVRKKISEANKGRPLSEETKQKIKEARWRRVT